MRQKLVVITFALLLLGTFALQIITPDNDISVSERRKLKQIPALTADGIFSGDFMADFDKYTLDQFPFRDRLRRIKALLSYNLFGKLDNNGIYIADGSAHKIEYPLNMDALANAVRGLNNIRENYLTPENRVFLSVIPDKNYYTAEKNGYPAMDYALLAETLANGAAGMIYIDIFDCLSAEDYYATDLHWRQERLAPVVDKLAEALGASDRIEPVESMQARSFTPFYGAYYGQAALPMPPDELICLGSDTLDAAVVHLTFDPENTLSTRIYAPEKFGGTDSYDIFLHGAAALVEIENKYAKTNSELIIFRDSFGSSIAPLFVAAYSKITLIDLRYISPQILNTFIEFENQDVLFLLSSLIINNSLIMKW